MTDTPKIVADETKEPVVAPDQTASLDPVVATPVEVPVVETK